MKPVDTARDLVSSATKQLSGARALARAGALPVRPDVMMRTALAARRWGATVAAGVAMNSMRYPDDVALVDDRSSLTWRDLHRRSNALAHVLADRGVRPRQAVALMCRNHRGFVEALLAVSKLGADAVFLNTGFAGPQLREVLEREGVVAAVYDEEFGHLFGEAGFDGPHLLAWTDSDEIDGDTIDAVIASGDVSDLEPPARPGRTVILTSGTTGTPKGAQRNAPSNPLSEVNAALSRIPLRAREPIVVAPPLFHGLGYGFVGFSLMMAAPALVRRRFDPELTLADIARHRATTMVVVPVMLRRILELPDAVRRRYDTSSLRVVVCSGAALPTELAQRFLDEFGDVLYNFYGTTEAAWAAVATPTDLREAPGTVGRPPQGTRIVLLDDDNNEVAQGAHGRIFVGNDLLFEGYTGGDNKEFVEGLVSTGDVGWFDDDGRLFVEGRDDDMIVSGGENVFPGEVEELLSTHDAVREVAVVGVEDDEMGQRLAAFVVPANGSPDVEELRSFVKQNLANYKVPRDIQIVDELPRTETGKVLRRELRGASDVER
ncbi:MAG: AMP-binding protein [Actinomycetes bacterium]